MHNPPEAGFYDGGVSRFTHFVVHNLTTDDLSVALLTEQFSDRCGISPAVYIYINF